MEPLNSIPGVENSNSVGEKDIAVVTNYIQTIVRPYLAKRNHLTPEKWFKVNTLTYRSETEYRDIAYLKGYEHIRQKIFNYYCNLTRLAVVNHVVLIMHEKSVNERINTLVPQLSL